MYENLREKLFHCRNNNLGNKKVITLCTDIITVGDLVGKKFKDKGEQVIIFQELLKLLETELDKENSDVS